MSVTVIESIMISLKVGGFMNTVYFKTEEMKRKNVNKILEEVYAALKEKGYDPTSQFVGYIMSGDPTYITNHNNARALITEIDRDEIVEELFNCYIEIVDEKKKACKADSPEK